MLRKTLKYLFILQEVSNKNRRPKLGRGLLMARRINPWNPLSYIALLLIVVVGILMFGAAGFWKEIDEKNPFKWD